MTGVVGGFLFRNINGKTVVSAHQPTTKKRKNVSALQQRTRSTFAEASRYAKAITRDPAKNQHYRKLAKKLGVSSAYTAAITDYMRKVKANVARTAAATRRKVITQPVTRPVLTVANASGQSHTVGLQPCLQNRAGKFVVFFRFTG